MPQKIKFILKKLCVLLFITGFLWWVIQVNIDRFNNNIYANYEKIVDYGRVRENKETILPVMAAIFYDDKISVQKNISTYYNQFDNYKKKNVKIVVVPKDLNSDSSLIVRKLYAEIYKYNQIESIALVLDDDSDVLAHVEMLKRVMHVKQVRNLKLTEENLDAEKIIDEYLMHPRKMVVVLADLSGSFQSQTSDFLLNETIYFAQQNFYHMEVFDVIDTKIAQSVDRDYRTLLSLTANKDEPLAIRQQRNLKLFVKHYRTELLEYIRENLHRDGSIIWPEKNANNFRLFDRGWVYVRFYDEEMQEIFARKSISRDKGVIVALIEIARKAALKTDVRKIKYIKISLLTDIEEIVKDNDTLLVNYLAQDDGVMIASGSKKTIFVADERPDDPSELESALKQRAGISEDKPAEDIHFYKFKSVEISDEN